MHPLHGRPATATPGRPPRKLTPSWSSPFLEHPCLHPAFPECVPGPVGGDLRGLVQTRPYFLLLPQSCPRPRALGSPFPHVSNPAHEAERDQQGSEQRSNGGCTTRAQVQAQGRIRQESNPHPASLHRTGPSVPPWGGFPVGDSVLPGTSHLQGTGDPGSPAPRRGGLG